MVVPVELAESFIREKILVLSIFFNCCRALDYRIILITA